MHFPNAFEAVHIYISSLKRTVTFIMRCVLFRNVQLRELHLTQLMHFCISLLTIRLSLAVIHIIMVSRCCINTLPIKSKHSLTETIRKVQIQKPASQKSKME